MEGVGRGGVGGEEERGRIYRHKEMRESRDTDQVGGEVRDGRRGKRSQKRRV